MMTIPGPKFNCNLVETPRYPGNGGKVNAERELDGQHCNSLAANRRLFRQQKVCVLLAVAVEGNSRDDTAFDIELVDVPFVALVT